VADHRDEPLLGPPPVDPNFSNNTPNGYGQFTTGGTNSPFTVNQQGFGNRPGF